MAPKARKSSGSPLGGSIRQFLHKCKVGLHKMSKEALESESSEEYNTVNGLFDTGPSKGTTRERVSEERNSSTSVTLTREMPLTDEEDELDSEFEGPDESARVKDVQTFATFDVVQECAKLRAATGEPFVRAEEVWRRRRELWVAGTNSAYLETAEKNREVFKEIAPRQYVRIYRKLVVDGAPLKRPLNLQDAMQVVNAGWIETQKWERAAKGLA
ncbi:LAQU0S01e02124g1_1 [Lachancea quebecensis]|uniref:LAQU0S01e02124g1_1 n=1 Tax=Lachancea quebecensis TaxID=1654605 RepID=A0A0N7MKR8_9SACH|nr:LAQU0S01e02124g1_1 [Lachancea quebecensis]